MNKFLFAALSALLILPSLLFAADSAPQTAESEVISGVDEDPIKSRLLLGNNRWVQMHALIQAGFQTSHTWEPAKGETKNDAIWSKDFYLSACRLSFNGQMSDNLFFFIQTDDLKAGTSSSDSSDTSVNKSTGSNHLFTQDAYLKFLLSRQFQFYVGLLTVPLSRQNLQSQATLLGTELLPAANTMTAYKTSSGYANNGRDTGFMIRGIGPGSHTFLEYRIGIFRGFDRQVDSSGNVIRNKHDYPRVTARIQFNPGDVEDGYFYNENYLGKKTIFAVGFGIDYQPQVYNKNKDYTAFGGDITFDVPFYNFERFAMSGQVGYYKAFNYPGDSLESTDTNAAIKGYSVFYAQIGLLMAKTIQPWGKYYFRQNDTINTGTAHSSYKGFELGLNYFINEHFENIKFSFDIPIGKNIKYPDEYKATLQFQGYL